MIVATLDTGALVAMERQKPRGMMLLRAAREHRAHLLAITPVVAEWWRGRSDVGDRIKTAVTLIPFPVRAAEAAGVVLGQMPDDHGRAKVSIDVMAGLYGGRWGLAGDCEVLSRGAGTGGLTPRRAFHCRATARRFTEGSPADTLPAESDLRTQFASNTQGHPADGQSSLEQ